MKETTKNLILPFVPEPVLGALRRLRQWRDQLAIRSFRFKRMGSLTFAQRGNLVRRVLSVNSRVHCAHTHAEMARILTAILSIPGSNGNVVEAGCFKGGSTIKLSIAAKLAGRRMIVFDSFEGLPDNDESHGRTIFGVEPDFYKGRYAGALEEVTDNVRRYGEVDICRFVKGWFDDTMPRYAEPIAVAFIDVDLAASTRTCLRYLYPLLIPGGVIFSQDGHLPLCIDVIRDPVLWKNIGGPPSMITGLGTDKLVSIRKPDRSH